MEFEFTSFLIGLLVGAATAVSISVPKVGRLIALVFGTLTIGAGVGGLVWSITSLVRGGEIRPVGWQEFHVAEVSEAIGWSGGLLIAGIAALLLVRGHR